jgi:hypothetical protein
VAQVADEAALLERREGELADRVALGAAERRLVGRRERREGGDQPDEERREELQAALSFLIGIGRTLSAETISAISFWMKRAVIGVPS